MGQDGEDNYTDPNPCDMVNEEPISFKGLTDYEVKLLFLICFLASLPVGIGVGVAVGMPALFLVIAILIPVLVIYFAAGLVESLRRGKPPGWLKQVSMIFAHRHRIGRLDIIYESRAWGLGRERER